MTKHLEEAAVNWICNHKNGEVLYVKDAFIAGAKWQKEQMMKEAVKCEYDQYPAVICLPAPIPRMDKGDKVRIIIVKKD